MGGKSNFLEAALLDHVFGATLYAPPATLYLAIYTTGTLTDASTGTNPGAVEVATLGTGYARVPFVNNATMWGPATVGEPTVKTNLVGYEFAPAEGDWGIITQWAILDALTGGNILYHGILPRYRDVYAGDILMVAAGQIRISED